jgi:hypothetical protein
MHFLLFGSAWFWIVLLVAVILMMTATEKGSGFGATITFLITIVAFWIFGNGESFGSLLSYGINHPWMTISIIIAYFVFGTGWAVLKWYFFLIDERDKTKEDTFIYAPKVVDHKGNILLWMFYWPFSAVWTVVDHPIKKIFLSIFNLIKNRMQAMSDGIFYPLVSERQQREEKIKQERVMEFENRRNSR